MAVYVKRKRKPLFPHFTSHEICFDTEGTGLIPYGKASYWGYVPARPFAFAFCDGHGNTAYFRFRVDPLTREVIVEPKGRAIIHRLMDEDHFCVIGHNIAYDLRMTEFMGEPIQHQNVEDTMVLAHIVTGGDELTYALKPLSRKYLKYPDDDERALEDEVKIKRAIAKANGWMIAIGKKELERGDRGVFAGNKPVKADYWLVPSPDMRQEPGCRNIDPTDSRLDLVQRYALGDVIRSQLLRKLWMPETKDPRVHSIWRQEMTLFWALRRMERRGTRVYPDHTVYLKGWYERYMTKQRAIVDSQGYPKLNLMSPKQLCHLFYTERKIPPIYTKKGQALIDLAETLGPGKEADDLIATANKKNQSFGKDQLAQIGAFDDETNKYKEPLAGAILEWRSAKHVIKSALNIYNTFWYPETLTTKVKKAADAGGFYNDEGVYQSWSDFYGSPNVWVLHPNYNQTGAITGRMTCSDPNLQQVASATTGLRKSQIPPRPRECFGPRPGCLWYLPDYSQIEVWMFAFLSGEKTMQKLLLDGHDFHQGVADRSFVHRSDYIERKKYYRKLSKLILFGKLFGGGVGTEKKPGRMCKLFQAPYKESKEFIESFDEQFAAVGIHSKKRIREIRKTGDLWNKFGRRYILGKDWAYKGVNYEIQGTAADILKRATIRVDYLTYASGRWSHPMLAVLNTIHDELIIEVPYELHCQRLMREIIYVMQMDSKFVGVPVPLPVGMKIATKRWSHTKDIKLDGMRKSGDNWVMGGVPYANDGSFNDLRRDMQACGY